MSVLRIINNENNESTEPCYTVTLYAQNGAPVNTWYEITYIDVYGVPQTTGFAAGQDVNDAFSVDCKYIMSSGGAVQGNSTEIPCPPPINSYFCNLYKFGYAGVNPGDIGVVDFINCDNVVTQTTLTWDESGGNYYSIEICAKEILNINSFVINEGIIGPC